jgi:hypothetical protein
MNKGKRLLVLVGGTALGLFLLIFGFKDIAPARNFRRMANKRSAL